MNNSFLRTQDYRYRDTLEKELTEQEEPIKFKKQQDNYQKRIRIERLPPPIPIIQVVEEPLPPPKKGFCDDFCNNFTEKKQIQICEQCLPKLCPSCQTNPQKITNCKCINILCISCYRAIRGDQPLQLRNYPIKIRPIDNLHFEECQCSKCHK